MFFMGSLFFYFSLVFVFNEVGAADDGHIYAPESFDAREKYSDCSQFFHDVGRSSFACGDCYAIASAQVLGTVNCIVENDEAERKNLKPLSSYYIITCVITKDPCEKGKDWQDLLPVFFKGLPTGENRPGAHGGCQNYLLGLCDRNSGLPMEKSCPNKEIETERYKLSKANCSSKCDDGSSYKHKLYGSGSALAHIQRRSRLHDYLKEIKIGIMRNGSVLASYFAGSQFERLQGCGGDCPMITENDELFKDIENHVVVLTGWGTEDGTPFWWVRNPNAGWTFGDNGYFRVKMGFNINNIERTVMGVQNYQWRNCRPLPFRRKGIFIVDGQKVKCKAEGGNRCPDGCMVTKTAKDPLKLQYVCEKGARFVSYIENPIACTPLLD